MYPLKIFFLIHTVFLLLLFVVAFDISSLQSLFNDGKYQDLLSSIDNLGPESLTSAVSILRAKAYINLGRVTESEALLIDITKVDSSCLEAFTLLAKIYIHQKKWDLAVPRLRYVMEKDPNNIDALVLSSKLFLQRDSDYSLSRRYQQQAHALKPDDEKILFDLGVLSFYDNDPVSGKRAFDRAGELNSKIDRSLLGRIYAQYRQYEWAVVEFEQVLRKQLGAGEKSSAVNSAMAGGVGLTAADSDILLQLADCRDALGQPEMALELLRNVVKLKPHNAYAHTGIGLILLGISASNFGAAQACGVNQEAAIAHFALAKRADNSITHLNELIRSAHEFCNKEVTEVKMWRQIVSDMKKSRGEGRGKESLGETSLLGGGGNSVSVILRKAISMLKQILARPLRLILKILQSFAFLTSNRGGSSKTKAQLSRRDRMARMKERWQKREATIPSVARRAITNDQDFLDSHVRASVPVVLTNIQKDWDVSTGRFSRSELVREFGSDFVRVSVSETGRFDGPENGTLWGLGPDVEVLVRPPVTSMLLADFFALLDSSTQETFYIEYLALHQYLGKKFLDLIPAIVVDKLAGQLKHLVTNLWIGGQPTVSPLHYDDYENLLCQIRGHKEITLFPPNDYQFLYYVGRPKATLNYSFPSNFIRDYATVERQKSVAFGSSVHMDDPNLMRYPEYRYAHPVRAVIGPGDCLFLPAFWHHEVQSIPADVGYDEDGHKDDAADTSDDINNGENHGLNIAVNFWFANVTAAPFI